MKILRLPDVIAKTGLSRWTIFRKERAGDFPRRVRLGANSVGWIEDEVESWLDRCAASRDAKAA